MNTAKTLNYLGLTVAALLLQPAAANAGTFSSNVRGVNVTNHSSRYLPRQARTHRASRAVTSNRYAAGRRFSDSDHFSRSNRSNRRDRGDRASDTDRFRRSSDKSKSGYHFDPQDRRRFPTLVYVQGHYEIKIVKIFSHYDHVWVSDRHGGRYEYRPVYVYRRQKVWIAGGWRPIVG